jgi:threonine dehydratase
VEPAAGDDVQRSFQTKILQSVHNPDTIADGARTSSAGKITFPLILRHVHDMQTVTDDELLRSMFKLDMRGMRVGVIISGGNVDLKSLAPLLA